MVWRRGHLSIQQAGGLREAKASLEKLAVGRARANELPPCYADVTDLYFIDVKNRDAFNQIMDAYVGREQP